ARIAAHGRPGSVGMPYQGERGAYPTILGTDVMLVEPSTTWRQPLHAIARATIPWQRRWPRRCSNHRHRRRSSPMPRPSSSRDEVLTDGYVHGYERREQDRLMAQAEHWREELILDETMLQPGIRLLEIGCGVGAVLGVLGEAFPGISLAGVDIEERQVLAAREHLAGLGLSADLRRADALALRYGDASFDHV